LGGGALPPPPLPPQVTRGVFPPPPPPPLHMDLLSVLLQMTTSLRRSKGPSCQSSLLETGRSTSLKRWKRCWNTKRLGPALGVGSIHLGKTVHPPRVRALLIGFMFLRYANFRLEWLGAVLDTTSTPQDEAQVGNWALHRHCSEVRPIVMSRGSTSQLVLLPRPPIPRRSQ